ncbi:MAG TPA: helix-turn-helix domain-containing protein [Gaiellaceae bacterium]|jgi:DNA-binding IclR family transcriptional regulator|nr:helix-turn-helix domain-containing protein [Gaiellaceae bacterium]
MSNPENTSWQFLTSHAQVLLCLQRNPNVRLRDVAETVGITERAAQRIVSDLVAGGYVTKTREGRRNRYALDPTVEMRHPSQVGHEIGELLDLLRLDDSPAGRSGRSGEGPRARDQRT